MTTTLIIMGTMLAGITIGGLAVIGAIMYYWDR